MADRRGEGATKGGEPRATGSRNLGGAAAKARHARQARGGRAPPVRSAPAMRAAGPSKTEPRPVLSLAVFAAILALCLYFTRRQPPPVTRAMVEAQRFGDGAVARAAEAPDGRLLEYIVCADDERARRAGFTPLVLHHGFAQTGKMVATRQWCANAAAHRFRIIAPSLPGSGLSDSYPVATRRRLEDWPADVAAILAAEGVDGPLATGGVSAGTVHAAVLARAMADRIVGVCLFTPVAPLRVTTDLGGMSRVTIGARRLLGAPYVGDVLGWVLGNFLSHRALLRLAPDVSAALDKGEELGGEHALLVNELLEDGARAVSHTWRGLPDTSAVVNADLPFALSSLSRVTARGAPVLISTSADDTTNPPRVQRWWAEGIPGARLLERPTGWGHLHFLFDECQRDMFAGLRSGGEAAPEGRTCPADGRSCGQ